MNSLLLGKYSSIGWVDTLCGAILQVLNPILIVVAVAGIIYAIWVGIKFVRAEDKSARDEAKAKLISVIVGIVVTVILIALFYGLALNIETIMGWAGVQA